MNTSLLVFLCVAALVVLYVAALVIKKIKRRRKCRKHYDAAQHYQGLFDTELFHLSCEKPLKRGK